MSEEAVSDKLAGHPPAVKIGGGVRITQSKKPSESEPSPPEKDDKEVQEKPNPNEDRKLLISGVVAKGDKDFPAEAIKAFHEKPLPSHDHPHGCCGHNIQQPRKH